MAHAIGIDFNRQIRAKPAQHPFAVVTRWDGFNHFGDAGRIQTSQQHGAFHLGRGDRQMIADRNRRYQAAHHQRQGSAGACSEFGAHLAERIDNAAHRAFR